jgi:patatin-like phospholipase/acyl hydrolase
LTIPDAAGKKPKYTAQDAADLYETRSKDIFSRSLLHEILSLGNLLSVKYEVNGIDKVLHEFFQNAKLSQVMTDVLIPSYDIESRTPYFFKSHMAKKNGSDFFIRDAARATSAAPTYFPPTKIQSIDRQLEYVLIDGGVVANDPAICAYAEAKALYPDVNKFFLLSIATAGTEQSYQYESAKHWGSAKWMGPILNIVFDGLSETVDYELKHIFMKNLSEENAYERLAVPTGGANITFDDARDASIRMLKEFAEKYIDDNSARLLDIAEKLIS